MSRPRRNSSSSDSIPGIHMKSRGIDMHLDQSEKIAKAKEERNKLARKNLRKLQDNCKQSKEAFDEGGKRYLDHVRKISGSKPKKLRDPSEFGKLLQREIAKKNSVQSVLTKMKEQENQDKAKLSEHIQNATDRRRNSSLG